MDLGLSKTLAKFMQAYPEVVLQVKIFNRDVDIIAEWYDISFQLMGKESKNSNLIMRKIADISSSFMLNPCRQDPPQPGARYRQICINSPPLAGYLPIFNPHGRSTKKAGKSR
jgi:DNA-binding transcriptional LysR family regulator